MIIINAFNKIQLLIHINNQKILVRIINDRACRRSEISSSNFIWNVHFCADFIRKDPQIACGGDLGASLICIHGNRPVIFGISSFAKNCGDPSWPGTYAKGKPV